MLNLDPFETEPELVAGLLAGDRVALEVFVRQFGPVIHGLAVQLSRGREGDGQDLFQQTFLHLYENDWRRLRQWRGEGSLEGYIRTTAKRLMLQTIRRRENGPDGNIVVEPPEDPIDLPTLDQEGFRKCIRDAMNDLALRDRQLIQRFHWQEQSYREIAAAEQMTVNHVGVALYRAQKRLAALVERLCARFLDILELRRSRT